MGEKPSGEWVLFSIFYWFIQDFENRVEQDLKKNHSFHEFQDID